jgi:hypothetical protein
MGVITAAIGAFLIAYPLLTGTIATVVLGWAFIFVGIAYLVFALHSQTVGEFFLQVLLAVIYGVAGVALAFFPNRARKLQGMNNENSSTRRNRDRHERRLFLPGRSGTRHFLLRFFTFRRIDFRQNAILQWLLHQQRVPISWQAITRYHSIAVTKP